MVLHPTSRVRGSPIHWHLLLAAAMMIDYVGKNDMARKLRTAIDAVLQRRWRANR